MKDTPVAIIGAGLSGLALGQALRRKGVSTIIYDTSHGKGGNTYGLTIPKQIRDSKGQIVFSANEDIAVDHDAPSTYDKAGLGLNDRNASTIRVNRARLEDQLSEGLDIRWQHALHQLELSDIGYRVRFSNGTTTTASTLIACDGVHSRTRTVLDPQTRFNVLLFVVYNSRRRVPKRDWQNIYEPHLQKNATSYTLDCTVSQARFEIAVNDMRADVVDVSCTYSRPAKVDDKLHMPDRGLSRAKDIPDELFKELATLHAQLLEPFSEAFKPDQFRDGRLLHWLMRTVLIQLDTLQRLADGGLALTGDAAHGLPIVGNRSGSSAMADGFLLADLLSDGKPNPIRRFYALRFPDWQEDVDNAQDTFAKLHQRAERLA